MTPSQRLRQLAGRTGLDGFADELRAMADEMDGAAIAPPAQPAPVQQPRGEMTDDAQIESLFVACGGCWTGDYWRIEDADLHPMLRTFIATPKPEPMPLNDSHIDSLIESAIQGHAGTRDAMRWLVRQLDTKKEPMTDIEISLGACNSDPGDGNDLGFRESWHEGFAEGARFAEAHHGITKEQA
jgi:hypothetical protein